MQDESQTTAPVSSTRRRVICTLGAAAAASLMPIARAQDSAFRPNRPLEIIVGYPPGGGLDLTTRIVAEGLGKVLGMNVVVQNRPGANGMISIQSVVRDESGGNVFFADAPGVAMNPSLFAKIPYDPLNDIQPVAQMVAVPWVLVVNPALGVKTLRQFTDLARSKSGGILMANTGASLMLAGELVKQKTNIPYTWVPYKGASQAAVAVVSGEVDAMITDTGTSLQLIRAGRLQPIMIISEARSLQLPDVPTSGELGLDLKAESWFGVFAASKTPKAAVDRLNSAVNEVLARPEIIAKLQALDFRPVARTPADFTTFYRSELKRWAAIVKNGNIKLD